jgi:hypothetical protein
MGPSCSHSSAGPARWLAVLGLALAGCFYRTLGLAPPEFDPNATFAAYRTHDGMAIARAEGGSSGTLDAAGWSGLTPTYHLRIGDAAVAELQVPSTAEVVIRAPGGGAPEGGVDPSWDDGAIRLVIRQASAERLHTRRFRTPEATSGLRLLTRNAQTSLDLRGTYRSDLLDPRDAVVGWLQVRVWEPSGRRVYEGVFPQGYPVAAAAAAALVLDSEIDWIKRYVYDATRGSAGGLTR